MSDDATIEALVARAGTPGADGDEAGAAMQVYGERLVPFLAAAYRTARQWQARTALIYYALPYARSSDEAFRLGLAALQDRSYMVRYRACMILAYSLRAEAVPALEALLDHADPRTREDAAHAIDAITHGNHHYFVDHTHSGQTQWVVRPEDRTL